MIRPAQRLPRERRLGRLRALLAGALLALTAALPHAAMAGEGGGGQKSEDPEVMRKIKMSPMLLPGRDRFSYVRLQVMLVVRMSKHLNEDVDLVTNLKPRINGELTEALTVDHVARNRLNTADIQALKGRIMQVANEAVGKPLVDEVLIVSLLVG
ncbi:hypothetical protein UCD39_19340 [Nitrospirillum sp. BR 11752]|uniref:Flagellar protein FliL n=1 Tax=Nitrospirillum amazonense TaxID=28077 RepID=A0A560H6J3_9PROT|nr:hypothetical protein [Nitrospirillum amazonense]MEE3626109.1 hypothetical protein [Nitrospirillum sp. BR 11752]TWB41933.1 hypothetical protein FBZ90_107311 [Nitrospirillum amazonense]